MGEVNLENDVKCTGWLVHGASRNLIECEQYVDQASVQWPASNPTRMCAIQML
jgi:hypothetical protein